jgi:hypothetical protein
MFERVKVAIVAAIVPLALVVAPVAAGNGEGDIPTFDSWLQGASGPLVSAIVGVALSFVVEWWPAYQTWSSRWKRLAYFGLCLVLPVGAACLRATLGYVAWSFDPLVWHALWHGVLAGGAGTVAHTRQLPTH